MDKHTAFIEGRKVSEDQYEVNNDKNNKSFSWFLLRVILAIFILYSFIAHNYYHPSFFDQFSSISSYYLGTVGSLITSFFLDWFGLGAYLIPLFIIFVDFNDYKLIRKLLFSFLLSINLIIFFSLFSFNSSNALYVGGFTGVVTFELFNNIILKIIMIIFTICMIFQISKKLNIYYYSTNYIIIILLIIIKPIDRIFSKKVNIINYKSNIDDKKTRSDNIMIEEEFNQFIDKISPDK